MKRVFVTYLIIVGTAVATGVGAGALIKRVFTEPTRDYSGFDPSVYKADGNAIIKKIESYGSAEAAFNASSDVEVVLYATEKYKRCENCYSYCIGLASTIVSQVIRNCQIKNGNTFFEEAVSKSSMVGVATRVFQNGIGNSVEIYSVGSVGDVVIDSSVSNYGKTPRTHECDEYVEMYGREPSDMFNYLIHKDTIKESSRRTLEDGSFEVTLIMDPDLSTYGYQHQMKTVSNLDSYPIFGSVKLCFTLTQGLLLDNLVVDETYKVVMGVPANINAHLEYKYYPNIFYKIPELDENFDYLKKGEH